MSGPTLAFPSQAVSHHDRGMTLRDYFAGQVVSALPVRSWDHLGSGQEVIQAWAKAAYAVADEMLKIRTEGIDPSGKTGA